DRRTRPHHSAAIRPQDYRRAWRRETDHPSAWRRSRRAARPAGRSEVAGSDGLADDPARAQMTGSDVQHLRGALRLAMNGRGRVEPNPMVGCVIAKGDRVIGEAFHAEFGGPHAEPAALANCSESPQGATAYV